MGPLDFSLYTKKTSVGTPPPRLWIFTSTPQPPRRSAQCFIHINSKYFHPNKWNYYKDLYARAPAACIQIDEINIFYAFADNNQRKKSSYIYYIHMYIEKHCFAKIARNLLTCGRVCVCVCVCGEGAAHPADYFVRNTVRLHFDFFSVRPTTTFNTAHITQFTSILKVSCVRIDPL